MRDILHQLSQHEGFRLRLNPAVLQASQLKQLLRKMAHFIALAQRDIQILLVLLHRQAIGLQA